MDVREWPRCQWITVKRRDRDDFQIACNSHEIWGIYDTQSTREWAGSMGKGSLEESGFWNSREMVEETLTGVRNWKSWDFKWDLMKTKWSNLWHINDWMAYPGPVLNLTLTPLQRSSHSLKTKKLFMSLSGGWEEEEGHLPSLSKKYYLIAFPSILLSGLIRVLKITVVSWTFIPLP